MTSVGIGLRWAYDDEALKDYHKAEQKRREIRVFPGFGTLHLCPKCGIAARLLCALPLPASYATRK